MPSGSPQWAECWGRGWRAAGLLLGLLLLWAGGPAYAQSEAAPAGGAPATTLTSPTPAATPPLAPTLAPLLPAPAEPFDWTGALLDLGWKLALVVVLAYVVLALLRRYSLVGLPGQRRGELQIQAAITLAPNRAVYLVRAGERRLVLGVTPHQITLLAELPPQAHPPAGTEAFAAALRAAHGAPPSASADASSRSPEARPPATPAPDGR